MKGGRTCQIAGTDWSCDDVGATSDENILSSIWSSCLAHSIPALRVYDLHTLRQRGPLHELPSDLPTVLMTVIVECFVTMADDIPDLD